MFNLEKNGSSTFEAVTVAEIKAHARIFTSADDTYLATLVISARQQVEADLNCAVVGQAYKLHLEYWYDPRYYWELLDRYGYGWWYPANAIYPKLVLPIQPVQAVQSITYTDGALAPQTLDPALYVLKTFKDPPHIMLLNNGNMPAVAPFTDIVVNFTTGYATANAIPSLIKHATMFLAAHWYEHREGTSEALLREVPQAYERIINRLRVKRFH
jgi:hypothetical protein